ncbi:MAG: hypothetical protein R3217_04100 [Gammaproteobacteria bacterium]|nr:hypothetical protein [Gammaproteobacteria bacterium]
MSRNPRASMLKTLVVLLAAVALAACSDADKTATQSTSSKPEATIDLEQVAGQYVRIVLEGGQHDAALVDAYYGPEEWQQAASQDPRSLAELIAAAEALRGSLQSINAVKADEQARQRYLDKQLRAVATRLRMVSGETFDFDRETALIYDSVAPRHDVEFFETALAEIDALLPGDAPLADRVETFRQQFVIPPEKLDAVFMAAMEACKERTVANMSLPEGESFVVEYVDDKPWSGYNWYQGGAHSLIQVNTDLPIFIDRAVDLGCHEGYPGHHTYNALLEAELVEKRGWVEFSVYALYSPQSLIAEGSANYGIEMAFPGRKRFEFERDVLMPIAGLPMEKAEQYWELRQLLKKLTYAGVEAARRYIGDEGVEKFSREEAEAFLVEYSLSSPERAAQRIRFFDAYGGYVINYNHGRDLVAEYVRTNADNEQQRWQVFSELLGSPKLPADLR